MVFVEVINSVIVVVVNCMLILLRCLIRESNEGEDLVRRCIEVKV